MPSSTPYIANDPTTATAPSSALPDWREIITIVLERVWIGILVAVAFFLYSWMDVERKTPLYRSTATLIVESQIPQLADFQQARFAGIRNLEYFNTHLKVLHSRRMMQRAIEKGDLAQRNGFTPGVEPGPRQVDAALRYVRINPVERTRMIEIRAQHPDRQIAADLANALARSYIQQELDNRMNASLQSVEWLRTRAADYRARLEEGFLGLQQYSESTQSVSLESDKEIISAKLRSLNSSLVSVQTELIDLRTKLNVIDNLLEKDAGWNEIIIVLEGGDAQQAYREVRNHQRKMDELRQRYRSEHPDYQASLETMRLLEKNFVTVSERAIHTMRARYDLLRERERNLQHALNEEEQKAFALDRKMLQYNDLKRNLQAEEQVYQAIIERMKHTSLADSLPSDLIQLAEDARPAGAPFFPNPRRAMMRGGALGLVLGLAAIFGLYFADHRFRRCEEVERFLGLPVLGVMPLLTTGDLSDRALVAHKQDTGETAEAFRTLRARLLMDNNVKKHKVLMITSAQAGEGKSFVATNLAISFAQDGQRTLLVGTDMRRPSLHRFFPEGKKRGLAEVLKQQVEWPEAVIRQALPGLDVLTGGSGTKHPAELLGSRQMQEFLASARKDYNRIILDSPPMLGLSDGLTLLLHSDSVLFVVRYGVTHSFSARHAIQRLESSGVVCAGVVMNGVNLRSIANYYYYRRYSSYPYYGYRYRTERHEA